MKLSYNHKVMLSMNGYNTIKNKIPKIIKVQRMLVNA